MIFEYQHNCIKNDDILVNATQPRLKIQCHARPHGEWCVGRESGIVPDGAVPTDRSRSQKRNGNRAELDDIY